MFMLCWRTVQRLRWKRSWFIVPRRRLIAMAGVLCCLLCLHAGSLVEMSVVFRSHIMLQGSLREMVEAGKTIVYSAQWHTARRASDGLTCPSTNRHFASHIFGSQPELSCHRQQQWKTRPRSGTGSTRREKTMSWTFRRVR